MTHHQRIREGIDACRPGSDDLHDPDLAFLADELAQESHSRELYERSQRVDAAIGGAMADALVPEGLAARILAGLVAAQTEPAPCSESQAAEVKTPAEQPRPASRTFSRRVWIAGVGIAVAASIVLVVASLPSGPEVNKDNLADLAREFFEAEQAEKAGGQAVEAEPPPSRYPLSRSILVANNLRWRRVTGLLGGSGVAYDVTAAAAGPQVRGTLYVVPLPATLTGLGATPPTTPLATTAGVAIGAWQSKGLLYVLAVRGDAKQYRLFVRAESIA
jgi:hypothetical protein